MLTEPGSQLAVEIEKLALVWPAATVTLDGRVANPAGCWRLQSEIDAPPGGAPEVNVRVATDEVPAVTLSGFNVGAARSAGDGLTVIAAAAVVW